ncbi:MAG TPA: hypothetical protein VFA45_11350 [Actinomycetes bacterium]|jgi:hypothetical protein|nr:hypothetical protein [Actinomycetes bacterium]
MPIVKNRHQLLAVAALLITLAAAMWWMTSREKVAAQTAEKKVLIETYAVGPVNGYAKVRTVRGATNPMCAGNHPRGGPGIPVGVIAWDDTFTSTYTVLGLRVIDQHGSPINTSVTVTCSMLIPLDVTP